MARFGKGARAAFGGSAVEGVFGSGMDTDISSAVNAIGKRELAEQISGTTNHSSREYKNARDYISRHLRGSRRSVKSPELAQQIDKANRQGKISAITDRGQMRVTINADVKVSSRTQKNGRVSAVLRGQNLTDYLNEINAGRYANAAGIVANGYGIPEGVTLTNVKSVTYS
jgi:hypothetical protein